jgi:hypothetical protein
MKLWEIYGWENSGRVTKCEFVKIAFGRVLRSWVEVDVKFVGFGGDLCCLWRFGEWFEGCLRWEEDERFSGNRRKASQL